MILFYDTNAVPYGCFSNLAPYEIELDGERWPTTEHYFQAQKFPSWPDLQEAIRTTPADEAKFIARLGRWKYEGPKYAKLRPDWEQIKDDVMRRAVLRKFEMHKDIRQILLDTGSALIVENAPKDYYWGIGSDGSGQNRLGKILMEARTILREG